MIRAFVAMSRDGFMAGVGAILMGRRAHDVVAGFGIDWLYGDSGNHQHDHAHLAG